MDKVKAVQAVYCTLTGEDLSNECVGEICKLFEPKAESSPMYLDSEGQWRLKPDESQEQGLQEEQ